MTNDEDHLLQEMGRLPPLARNPEREARVRTRCRAAIASRVARQKLATGTRLRILDLAAAVALCLYVAVVFSTATTLTQ